MQTSKLSGIMCSLLLASEIIRGEERRGERGRGDDKERIFKVMDNRV